jgi:adenosylhomocysteine nucleosidase
VIIGIVVALPEELGTLTSKRVEKGRIEQISENILVVCSGVGGENASASAEMLVKEGAERLVSWGCAAALDASFRPGDLVLADTYVDADQVDFELNNKDWIGQVLAGLSKQSRMVIRTGKLAESKRIVALGDEKAQIAYDTGAVALDMESIAIAKVARLRGLPFLAVRAVADPSNMDLPQAISYALDDQGEVVLSKLLMFLLFHPTEIPGLVKLGLNFYAAKRTLKLVAKQLQYVTALPKSTYANQIE